MSKRVYRGLGGNRISTPCSVVAADEPRRDLGCGRMSFEGGRTDLAERRMSATLVIKHLEVIEQRLGVAVTGNRSTSSFFMVAKKLSITAAIRGAR